MAENRFYEGTDIRVDSTLVADLQHVALELGDNAAGLTHEVMELATYLASDHIDLERHRELLQELVVKLTARAYRVNHHAGNVLAIRDKASDQGRGGLASRIKEANR